MSGHTLGPWVNDAAAVNAIDIMAGGERIATIYAEEEISRADEANARLIAAAPDLLAAAEDALETLEIEFPGHPYSDQLRAAIAKATGAP